MPVLSNIKRFYKIVDYVLEDLDKIGGVANMETFYNSDTLVGKDDVFTFLESNNCIQTNGSRLRITPTGRMWLRKGGFCKEFKIARRSATVGWVTLIVSVITLIFTIVTYCIR